MNGRNNIDYKVGAVAEIGIESTEVSNFYKNNWKRKIALSIPSFYQWQFCEAPENNLHDMCCVAVDKNDNILGVMGLNKRPFYISGVVYYNAAELTTWVVSEQARGLGVGRSIMRYLQSKYDVLFGMGISADALPIYMTSNFRFMRYIPRFVKVFNLEVIRPYAKIESLGEKLIQNWNKNHEFTGNADGNAEKASVECLKKPICYLKNTYNHYIRDDTHLRWRYIQHPVYKYHIYRVGDAATIIRIDQIQELRIAHVMDAFGKMADIKSLVQFIDTFCLYNKVHVVDFYCTAPAINAHFLANGWFSVLDDYYFQFPHLFYPPEVRMPPTTSLTFWSSNKMGELLDTSKTYITKGDLDLDRPTVEFYDKHCIPKY